MIDNSVYDSSGNACKMFIMQIEITVVQMMYLIKRETKLDGCYDIVMMISPL